MHINNLGWWLIIILNFAGYSIFRFGSSKNGILSPLVEFIGGTMLLFSFILMGFVFGLKEVAILIVVFMLPITLLNEFLFYKGKLVKRQDESVQNDLKMLEEIMPGIMTNDHKFKDKLNKHIHESSTMKKPQPFSPTEFPTLVKYDSQKIEDSVQSLMKSQGQSRQQALVNLEMDLAEREQLATGGN